MVNCALLLRLEAQPGKEAELEQFLKSALPLVEEEPETVAWFAVRMGPREFGIFDAFSSDTARQLHLAGKVAEALKQKAADLLSKEPIIDKIDVLADKLPGAPSRIRGDLPPEAFAP